MIRFYLILAEKFMNDVVKLLLSTKLRKVLQVVVDLTQLREDVGQVVKHQPLFRELLELRKDLNTGNSRTELNDIVELE